MQAKQLKIFSALRESCIDKPYNLQSLLSDAGAGVTVGIIAIPLAMALAIASGVPPQYGLYTAVIAGIVIALTGGSRYSISGPTAAFVVILFPISQQFGLSGLLVATLFSGVMLVLMAMARLGRLIGYIPLPVTLGFTMGIGIVIASLQLKDFLGLPVAAMPERFHQKMMVLATALPGWRWEDASVGMATLLTLILWPKLKLKIPGHLPAVLVGVAVAWLVGLHGESVATIGSRFTYLLPNGQSGHGIPAILPHFTLPWELPGPGGLPVQWDLVTIERLLVAAFSMAMLGAIESLLCAVVLDGMTNSRHHSNGELLGQGIGNIIAPFFGGITATAAIARSAANVKAGAKSPVAAIIHAIMVLAAILFFARWLSYLPLASMAALLLMVAWNMSEAHKVIHLFRSASRADIAVLLVCILLTVFMDMVIAISFGVVMASLLFMREMARMTIISDLERQKQWHHHLPDGWRGFRISGPLFFAAADRVFSQLQEEMAHDACKGMILMLDGVSVLDAGGLAGFERFCKEMKLRQIRLIIAEIQFQPLRTLAKANFHAIPRKIEFTSSLEEAVMMAR